MQKSQLLQQWREQSIIEDEKILKAFSEIKREDFIPKEYQHQAYEDSPLPLGHGATISQPTTIMLMTEALELKSTGGVNTLLDIVAWFACIAATTVAIRSG